MATFSITVTPVNDAPVCANDSGTVAEDEVLDDAVECTDVDGDPLTYELVDDVTDGVLARTRTGRSPTPLTRTSTGRTRSPSVPRTGRDRRTPARSRSL